MFDGTIRGEADRLGAWWDDLLRGQPTVADVDATLARTIHAFQAIDDVPAPDPAFLARLETRLLGDDARSLPATIGISSGVDAAITRDVGAPQKQRRSLALPPVASTRRWVVGQFATAVLLVITLVGAYLAFGPGRPASRDALIGPPAADPTTDTAEAGLTTETVLDITIPGGVLEMNPSTVYFSNQYWLAADATLDAWYPCDIPGFWLVYVVSGTLSVHADQPLDIVRAAGDSERTPEALAPNTEALLNQGDGFAYVNTAGAVAPEVRFANPGPERLVLTEFAWINDVQGWGAGVLCSRGRVSDAPIMLIWESYGSKEDLIAPAQPITVRLRRFSVQPGASLPNDGPAGNGLLPIGAGGLEILGVESGLAGQSYLRPDDGSSPERTYSAFSPATAIVPRLDSLAPGMTRVVRNAGDDPLVLVAWTVVPMPPPV